MTFDDNDTDGTALDLQQIQQRISQGIRVDLKKTVINQLGENIGEQKIFKRLVRHTLYCWTVLTQKRLSLRLALDVLRNEVWPETWKRLNDTKDLVEVEALLQNLFLNWLRVKDGLILVTSGECRHEGDIHQAANSRLKSHLNKNTKIFKADLTYSAAAWDEWNDPTVGLLSQWKGLCRKPSVWKIISREAKLDFLMNATGGDIQGDFNDLKAKFLQKLRIRFRKADLRTDDKLEELKVSLQGTSLVFERRGKKFQINGKDGVLPHTPSSGESLKAMWRKLMSLPKASEKSASTNIMQSTNKPAVKRRVIALDEDDEEQSPKKPPQACGLNVSKKESSASTEVKPEQSLNDIKRDHGFNPNELADAREILENEDDQAQDEIAKEMAEFGLRHQAKCEEKVKACQQRLMKQSRFEVVDQKQNLEGKLNAQDSYREALVEAGNAYLWSRQYESRKANKLDLFQKQGRTKELEKASSTFQMALEIIEKQGKTLDHLELYDPGNYEGQMLSRSDLELSAGRALANSGIVQIKIWEMKEKLIYLARATKDLDKAMAHASTISIRARRIWDTHFTKGKPSEFLESIFVLLYEASELQCLVSRWKATAQWHNKEYEQSLAAFQQAAALIDTLPTGNNISSDNHLKLRSDCFSCLTTAYDLLRMRLGSTTRAQLQANTFSQEWCTAKMKAIIDVAAIASHKFEMIVRKSVNEDYAVDKLMQDYDVVPSGELFEVRDQDMKWWGEKKRTLQQSISLGLRASNALIQADVPYEGPPLETFTVSVFGSRSLKRKRKDSGGNTGRVRSRRSTHDENPSSSSSSQAVEQSSKKYQKWGDELLPHTLDPQTGKQVLQLRFPCLPPTKMSAEVAAIAKRIGYPVPESDS